VRVLDGARDLVEADVSRGEPGRVHLDSDGILLRTEDLDLRYTPHRRQTLRQTRLGVLVDDVQRQGARADREQYDRLVGGVHLAIAGRHRHVARQTRQRPRDRALYVLCGAVEVTPEIELQG